MTIDYWLFEWESNISGNGKPEKARQDWFTQEPLVLLFLPTRNSWDTLAYINWFGTSDFGSQYYIALLKSWFECFDAELVAHYGTMLQFNVSKPPKTRKEAWGLANEHDLVAPCTLALPSISLRHHALGLINYNRWFLYERP